MKKFYSTSLFALLFIFGFGQIISDVPYFYQYNNTNNPDGSCQNTCLAMVLKYYGMEEITPDAISQEWGTSYAQTVSGLEAIFNTLAERSMLEIRDIGTTNGSIAKVKEQLDNNIPVIVHAYFTGYGHLVVVTGYDDDYYYVNDPAGTWNTVVCGGGYSGDGETDGHNHKYPKEAMEKVLTSSSCSTQDGKVWMHAFTQPLSSKKKALNKLDYTYDFLNQCIRIKSSNLTSLRILDQSGRLIQQIKDPLDVDSAISLSALPAGMYIIQARNDKNEPFTAKIIKP